jgi:hypothetical protein
LGEFHDAATRRAARAKIRVESRIGSSESTDEQWDLVAGQSDRVAALSCQITNDIPEICPRGWQEAGAYQFIVNHLVDALALVGSRQSVINARWDKLGRVHRTLHQKASAKKTNAFETASTPFLSHLFSYMNPRRGQSRVHYIDRLVDGVVRAA